MPPQAAAGAPATPRPPDVEVTPAAPQRNQVVPDWNSLWRSVGLLGLAIAGVAFGAAVLLGDALLMRLLEGEWRGRTPFDTFYSGRVWAWLSEPESALWLSLLIGSVGLWACLLPPFIASLRRWGRPRGAPALSAVALLLVLIAAFVVTPRLSGGTPSAIPAHFEKIVILTGCGFVVAVVGIATIWSVQAQAAALGTLPADTRLTRVLELRRSLGTTLAMLGALLGSAILSAGALLHARRAAGEEGAQELVLLYGGFLSILIALVYFPAWRQLQASAEELADEVAPIPDPRGTGFSDGLELRTSVRELLQLDVGVVGSFRAGISILAPLASGLVSLLLSQAS